MAEEIKEEKEEKKACTGACGPKCCQGNPDKKCCGGHGHHAEEKKDKVFLPTS